MTDLRSELLPPHVDEKLLKEVEDLIEDVADTGKTMSEREKSLADLTDLLKPEKPIEFLDLQEYWGWTGLKELALQYARKIPAADVSYEELREIMKKINAVEDYEYYLALLQKNFAFPDIICLVYNWPSLNQLGEDFDLGLELGKDELTFEEIADIIWEYEKTRDISRFKRKQS